MRYVFYALLIFVCSACSTITGQDVVESQNIKRTDVQQQMDDIRAKANQQSRVKMYETSFPGLKIEDEDEILRREATWLDRKISISITKPVDARTLMQLFHKQGVNISSDISGLSGFVYSGFGVHNAKVDTALQAFFGALGLSWDIDYVNKIIILKPMPWATYYVNIGNRMASFSTGEGSNGAGVTINYDSTSSSQSSQNSNKNNDDEDEDENIMDGQVKNLAGTSISAADNFWGSLSSQISQMLTVMIPVKVDRKNTKQAPALQPLQNGNYIVPYVAPDTTQDKIYDEVKIGRFTMNPETGSIQVQAPRWIQRDIKTYIERINDQYNTQLTFEGKIFMLSMTDKESRGLDLQLFQEFAGREYGLVMQNKAGGGISVTAPTDSSAMVVNAANAVAEGSGLWGVAALDNTLTAFSAFLSQWGDVSVVQSPTQSTTSGIPVEFKQITPRYYNTVSQTTASSNGGAVQGTQNELKVTEVGTELTINPTYSPDSGMIRAQIDLLQRIEAGVQSQLQYLSNGESVLEVPIQIPLVTQSSYSGEAILRPGDMIILGGLSEDSATLNDGGTTGLKDTFLGPIVGAKDRSTKKSTYFFALQVKTERK